ncbi:MAG TPA: tripartite tricarboxylate transporter substrate binding protein, partial [Noviherbaspirillum sp.]|nr:tripartite tricarboxylate transporter substrate binding protein [Noviherbaspirillum sp.]
MTAASAIASGYPTKPITMIVPFAAGGSTDGVARAIAQQLGERLGKPVIVENKAGAGGTIGSHFVARAQPDGYTILLGTVSTNAVAGSLYERLPYDTVKSFTPITEIATVPELLVVHPSVPAKNVKELVEYVKARPNQLSFASAGPGSASHLAAELFMSMTGTKMVHVPYRGSGPALQDTLGNHTQVMFDVVMTSHSHVRAGTLRALGVTSSARSSVVPDVPTVAEAGVPGYEAIVWFGVFGPAGMPADVTNRLQQEIAAALKTPKLQELLAAQG